MHLCEGSQQMGSFKKCKLKLWLKDVILNYFSMSENWQLSLSIKLDFSLVGI